MDYGAWYAYVFTLSVTVLKLILHLAWRDFYISVMASFPRVSMGRPFNDKYDAVKWEEDEEKFKKWKEGKTGVPIVDAAMRQMNTMGLLPLSTIFEMMLIGNFVF